MSDAELLDLYSARILALASDIPHLGTLPAPTGTERRRAPHCGSWVEVSLVTDGGRITDFAQDVHACALGQAAAAVLGKAVIGLDRATLARGHAELEAMLTQNGPAPSAPFEEFEVLRPARGFPNRHGSILLATGATLAAFDQALAA